MGKIKNETEKGKLKMGEPKEYPILFTGPMVQAILEGRKTQTRRVIRPQPTGQPHHACCLNTVRGSTQKYDDGKKIFSCPYGEPGGRLWLRETWNAWMTGVDECDPYLWTALKGHNRSIYEHGEIAYRATDSTLDPDTESPFWAPSIYMPRWASRILLEVVSVRVERVQAITRVDAKAEGFHPGANGLESWAGQLYGNSQLAFQACWDSINAKRGHGWDENPWVWVIEFKIVEL